MLYARRGLIRALSSPVRGDMTTGSKTLPGGHVSHAGRHNISLNPSGISLHLIRQARRLDTISPAGLIQR
jgi:hypothetical protein